VECDGCVGHGASVARKVHEREHRELVDDVVDMVPIRVVARPSLSWHGVIGTVEVQDEFVGAVEDAQDFVADLVFHAGEC
jgi:hypothetical protein